MDKQDVEKIYKEVSAEKRAWLNLTSFFWELNLHITEMEHPDEKRLEKVLDGYSQDKLDKLKETNKDAEKPTTLRVLISDLQNIGTSLHNYEILKNENLRLQEIENKLKESKEIYSRCGRKDKLLTEISRKLGWSTGKRPNRIPSEKIFWEYQSLVEKESMDKKDALKLLLEKYYLENQKALIKHIQKGLKIVKKRHDDTRSPEDSPHLASHPNFAPNRFKGILPSTWPSTE